MNVVLDQATDESRVASTEAVGPEPLMPTAAYLGAAVPVPAVAELVRGWRTVAASGFGVADPVPHHHGHDVPDHGAADTHHHADHDSPAPVTMPGEPGELATPTGVALVRALATRCEGLPALEVSEVGVGAGSRNFATHPNVVRVILGQVLTAGASAPDPNSSSGRDGLVELRANVDDMDPRLWPAVLDACLGAGAVDAWLVPIVMKKGRPAHTLHALAYEQVVAFVADTMLTHTTTLGVRQSPVTRQVLERAFTTVRVDGQVVQVKVASRGGVIVHAAAEFESLADAARSLGRPQAEIAQRVTAAIVAAGLVPGAEG